MAKTILNGFTWDVMYSKKIPYDKFFTTSSVARQCLSRLVLTQYDCVIEPSAGDGAFLALIDHPYKIGLDINPCDVTITRMSWFDYRIPTVLKNVLVVGNPPFGIRNQLSLAFIQHAAEFPNVQTIAFILPNVYQKHTLQKKISSQYRLSAIIPLPENAFVADGQTFHLPCSFFILDRGAGPDLRFQPDEYRNTLDWEFGTKEHHDFFVMGAAIYTVKDDPTPNNRGYYIKVNAGKDASSVRQRFQLLQYRGLSSASGGVAWVTKPELVKAYREQFENESK